LRYRDDTKARLRRKLSTGRGEPGQTEPALKKKRGSKGLRRGFISVGSVCPAFTVLLLPEISRTTSSDHRGK
jgi:hypothetical protein